MVGAVTVPVNTRFKADELAYCLPDGRTCFLTGKAVDTQFDQCIVR